MGDRSKNQRRVQEHERSFQLSGARAPDNKTTGPTNLREHVLALNVKGVSNLQLLGMGQPKHPPLITIWREPKQRLQALMTRATFA